MTVILTPVTVDAYDLEKLIRQAHTVIESEPMLGLTPKGHVFAYGMQCACGVLFVDGDEGPTAYGQHAEHVERAVRNGLEGRL